MLICERYFVNERLTLNTVRLFALEHGLQKYIILNIQHDYYLMSVIFFDLQCESSVLVAPYLEDMTRSELHAVITGGLATVAGGTLAAYIFIGIDPTHLIAASVMSAPAALAISKIVYPETEKSKLVTEEDVKLPPRYQTDFSLKFDQFSQYATDTRSRKILMLTFKGRGSHLQTIPIIMNFGMDEKYTVMIICMKSQKCTLKNF